MNENLFIFAMLLVFVAVFLAIEGLYLWWKSTRSAEAIRIARRLRMISDEGVVAPDQVSVFKQRPNTPAIERILRRLRGLDQVDRLLVQSGVGWPLSSYAVYSAGLLATGLFALLLAGFSVMLALGTGCLLGLLPTLYLISRRADRLQRFALLLPEALDLIGRALRAGHSFSSALQLAGNEMPDPLATEFRQTFDEISFGVATPDALKSLAKRVPSTDLGFFVVAVLIQSETGGNLSEVLFNISSIIRERLTLLGKVKALSAEGRYSGVMLTILPFATALMLYLINPKLMSVLWTDPSGIFFIKLGLAGMLVGAVWMRRVVRIRV